MNCIATDLPPPERLRFGVRRPSAAFGRRAQAAARWPFLQIALLVALLLLTFPAQAERPHLQPTDFQPLTSLPWKKPGATMPAVLDTIYRGTNQSIRHRVLGEYLRAIPANQLGAAFDLCVTLEDAQSPDKLADFFLPIWAERDPENCWQRVQALIRVTGIQEGWLTYDSWRERPAITVHDLAAIRASAFWLSHRGLVSFPEGLERSALPVPRRLEIMKEFAVLLIGASGKWPAAEGRVVYSPTPIYGFELPVENLRDYSIHNQGGDKDAYEIAARRWLEAEPARAPEIVPAIFEARLPAQAGESEGRRAGPSTELLIIWARLDLPAMIRWADSRSGPTDELTTQARAFLMSRVDAPTRKRWLAEVEAKDDASYDALRSLLIGWAIWDPVPAMEAVLATQDLELIERISVDAHFGPFHGNVLNTAHHSLDAMRHFDASRLPRQMKEDHYPNWEQVMEVWGDIDIGAAARYGFDFLRRTNYAPRENLIKLFSGDDAFASDGDMIDRTFCALRVWAVVQPKEMAAWIAMIKDAEMRKALTRLLETPWGGAKE